VPRWRGVAAAAGECGPERAVRRFRIGSPVSVKSSRGRRCRSAVPAGSFPDSGAAVTSSKSREASVAHSDGIIIAIDGPAGSGKSSTAREVARRLGYRHLDSGAFYRAITLAALRAGIAPERWEGLTPRDLDALNVRGRPEGGGYALAIGDEDAGEALRAPEVNAHVSRMAAVPAVRGWLMDALRRAGERGALVADGRDIGTAVFPRAELKTFLVADPEERARRRLREAGQASPDPEQVRAEAARLLGRDALDSGRAAAPLRRAEDAVVIDTTRLAFEEQVERIVALARARGGVDRDPGFP
jgi:cytidylate kinase